MRLSEVKTSVRAVVLLAALAALFGFRCQDAVRDPIGPGTAGPGPAPSSAETALLFETIGPVVPPGSAGLAELTKYDERYMSSEAARYNDFLRSPGIGANHYGGLRSRLMWAIRNGEPIGPSATSEEFAYGRGRAIVRHYLQYSKNASFAPPPHNNTALADIEAYYLLEGDPDARQHIWVTAMASTSDRYGYLNFTNPNSDARQPAVFLQAAAAAHRLGIPWAGASGTDRSMNLSHGSWINAGRWLIDHALSPTRDPNKGYQPNGAIWSTAHAGQAGGAHNEAYLFNAMLATTLLQWWGWVDPYQLAYDAARKIMDHILSVDAVAEAAGRTTIPYVTHSGGSSRAAEDLAAFYVWPALVLWQETGDSKYRTFALRQLAAANRTSSISGLKQWNQIYATLGQGAEALLSGARWR